jgi:penicillin amidase
MRSEWLAYGSDAKRVVTAFVNGVNAFVRLTRTHPDLLPVEFKELGYEPDFWVPSDIPRMRSHGVFGNVREEVARALTLRDYGPQVEEIRRRREPAHELKVPEGLDLSLIPDDVLRDFDLATLPPRFDHGSLDPKAGRVAPEGSNNWALSGGRTTTGRPMLANDPHRAATGLPGLRYIAHVCAPDFDVIGGGEPGLPGISIGHNGHVAFGLTTFAIDQEDLYVYNTNPDNPAEYRYQGRWESMRIERETVAVKGEPAVEVELAFTRHGPVIYADPARRTAFALRAAWLEPGMAPYLGSIESMRTASATEFLNAMNRWGSPPLNKVFADVFGNIGWKPVGLTPKRPNWDGTLPVPGDGRYEWAGFYDNDELPAALNPEAGVVASANEMNLPADYPKDRVISYDWFAPYRRHRINEVLAASDRFELADMVRLQNDFLSIPARHILDKVRSLPLEPDSVPGLEILLDWDAVLRPDSAAAALFEVWYRRHLRPALRTGVLERLMPADRIPAALTRITLNEELLADARVDLDLLENPNGRFGPDPDQFLASAVKSSLSTAVAEMNQTLGNDPRQWSWGRLHVAHAVHPLKSHLNSVRADLLSAGPLPRGGSGDTVCDTAYGPDFAQTSGSTFRVAIDVGGWDNSLAMNAPGQSGRLDSPHCHDLFARWACGESFPLLYSRSQVEGAAEQVIQLVPAQNI